MAFICSITLISLCALDVVMTELTIRKFSVEDKLMLRVKELINAICIGLACLTILIGETTVVDALTLALLVTGLAISIIGPSHFRHWFKRFWKKGVTRPWQKTKIQLAKSKRERNVKLKQRAKSKRVKTWQPLPS